MFRYVCCSYSNAGADVTADGRLVCADLLCRAVWLWHSHRRLAASVGHWSQPVTVSCMVWPASFYNSIIVILTEFTSLQSFWTWILFSY